ncbi:MOXD1 homolog 1 [Diachasmimorpha longicaudata]|uniref:MOXD1 homolog 1 n=1 Tax=Diachasmimorpha longicaudata TaxID=58733 RepID=UPI0030B8AC70
MKILVLTTIFLLVEADLLDLYVQHMDETMGTNLVKRHPKDVGPKPRGKRHLKGAMRYGHFRKQRLDVEDDWWIDKKVLKKAMPRLPIPKPDGLAFPNLSERNNNSEDHEVFMKKQEFQKSEGFSTFAVKDPTDHDDVEQVMLEGVNDDVEIISDGDISPGLKGDPSRTPKKYHLTEKMSKYQSLKQKRSVSNLNFTRREILDDVGDVILEWDPSDEEIVTFRVTAKTLGYVGIGFNEKSHMMGADLLLAWVDDHDYSVNVLDLHGLDTNAAPIIDQSQDVDVLGGSQNGTHTTITFSRSWQTCDPEDRHLNEDNVRVLWALQDSDPELNTPVWHGESRGARALRLRGAVPKPSPPHNPDIRHWDVKLNQYAVDDKQDTIYWCKIFKAPPFNKKHHMIGYEPLVEKGNEGLVHHMILYECASTSPQLGKDSKISGSYCYDPTMPREWETCIQPIVAWARGSKGEWFAEHVGIPVAEHKEGSYYMLEVHYNNPTYKKAIDSSGIRLHLTPVLRPHEAGIFVAGVAVSPLHLIPPHQKEYATAGYCSPDCTNKLFPEDGVNVISVVLHSHLAGRRLSLKHIRNGEELPPIAHENRFDFDYQQSHSLDEEVKILPGDQLVTECVYDTHDRANPTLGGYAATQEMCLSFVVYYPRTDLAGCYSMTPATDLFKTLGVTNFKGVSLDNLEKLFLTTGVEAVTLPTIVQQQLPVYPATRPSEEVDEEIIKETETAIKAIKEFTEQVTDDNVFARLVIEDPKEFRGRTLAEHMSALAWTDELLTRAIENRLYHGRHMTFCRKRDDKLAIPSDIQMFPNVTRLPEKNQTVCRERRMMSSGTISLYTVTTAFYIFALSLFLC